MEAGLSWAGFCSTFPGKFHLGSSQSERKLRGCPAAFQARRGGMGLGDGAAGLQQVCAPLIPQEKGPRRPRGSQPAALALRSGKNEAARLQPPQLPAALSERQPDPEDKEKKDPCWSDPQTDLRCGPSCHLQRPESLRTSVFSC